MINIGTFVDILDNSGALTGQCIGLYKQSRRKGASLGDIILIVVKNSRVTSKVSKGKLSKALIVHTKKNYSNKRGIIFKFNRNSVLLLDNKMYPISSRFRGPMASIVFKMNILKKLLSLGGFIL